MRLYKSAGIVRELMKAGVMSAKTVRGGKQNLSNWERQGKLRLRRMPISGHRVATQDDVDQIIKEFSPGGSGVFRVK